MDAHTDLIDWDSYAAMRGSMGAHFFRILGYFREDGTQSVDRIEAGMRNHDAAAMILPAHTLKGEALQFGAFALSLLAEEIEAHCRHCVEHHQSPDEILGSVVQLRSLFSATLALLENRPEVSRPFKVPSAPPLFGRRGGGIFG